MVSHEYRLTDLDGDYSPRTSKDLSYLRGLADGWNLDNYKIDVIITTTIETQDTSNPINAAQLEALIRREEKHVHENSANHQR